MGLACLIELFIYGLYNGEGGRPSWYAVLPTFINMLPFMLGLAAGFKWPLIGGIWLALLGFAFTAASALMYFGRPTSNTTAELVEYWSRGALGIGLPYFLTGILYLLSIPKKTAKQAISR